MAEYITIQELERRVGATRLINLTGSLTGLERNALVQEIATHAGGIVEGFASAYYQPPLPSQELVKEWVLTLSEYELYKRGPGAEVPQKIADARSEVMKQLDDLAKGLIKLGPIATNQAAGTTSVLLVSKHESLFDSDSMKGF